jgi:AraC-like DNA-binding protein
LESLTIHYNLHPGNLIIISGILQVCILSIILFFQRKTEPIAHRLLAALMLVSAMHFSGYMIMDSNLDQIIGARLLRIPLSYLLAIGPLVFFYTSVLTIPDYRFKKSDLLHFLPVGLELLLQLILAFYSAVNDQQVYQTSLYLPFKIAELLFTAASVLYYVKRSLSLINRYELSLADYYSDHAHLTLAWLSQLIYYIRVLWVSWVLFEGVFVVFWLFQLHYVAVYLMLYALLTVMTYSTYWIGLKGFQAGMALSEKRFKIEIAVSASTNFFAKMSAGDTAKIAGQLEAIMKTENLYRHENLSLQMLADRMQENPNLLSHVLNNTLHQSFYDYVNRYRVEEVKRKIHDPKYAHLKLIEIAFECGFNSKATFNRAFKKLEGVPPTTYRNEKHENS